jgi:hypothetical protein
MDGFRDEMDDLDGEVDNLNSKLTSFEEYI